jgi:ketosteroid isomerase-like protein
MNTIAVSRRTVLGSGLCALMAAAAPVRGAGARAEAGLSPQTEDIVHKYYAAWEKKDWRPFDILLADDFTFTSPNNDDHISKSAFKKGCWESQADFIERFDLERVIGHGNDAFVLYVCRTKNGKSFRNVEYLRTKDDKLEAIEVFFGAQSSFASAVGSKKD